MEQDIQKQIEARMAELPEDVRAAIMASDFEDKVRAIGAKHALHIDQIGKLGDEVMLAMLGFTPINNLAKEVEAQINIPQADAEAIATEIGNEIFLPIRESMKRFTEQKAAAPEQPAPAIATPTPAAPVTIPTPATPTAPALSPTPIAPPKPADMPAEVMLNQKTASVAPPTAPGSAQNGAQPAPEPYKADPYRELPE